MKTTIAITMVLALTAAACGGDECAYPGGPSLTRAALLSTDCPAGLASAAQEAVLDLEPLACGAYEESGDFGSTAGCSAVYDRSVEVTAAGISGTVVYTFDCGGWSCSSTYATGTTVLR